MTESFPGRTPNVYPWSIDESELTVVEDRAVVIEAGGNATLIQCTHADARFLFKRFRDAHLSDVNEDALARLIQWRFDLSAADRSELDRITSWPRARVVRDGRLRGVVIPVARDTFLRTGARNIRTPRSMYDLINIVSRPHVPLDDKLRALSHAIHAILWLHEQGVIINDVQPENLLCAEDGGGIYVVDCDSMASPSRWGLVAPPTAPDLIRVGVPDAQPATVATDFAKLALISMRTLLDEAAFTRFGPEAIGTLGSLVSPATAEFLNNALDAQVEDATAWRVIADSWAERAGAAPAPEPRTAQESVRIPVMTPPGAAYSGAGRRGWLPRDFDYKPAPAPFILPARHSFDYARRRRAQSIALALTAACVAVLLVIVVITHPELIQGL